VVSDTTCYKVWQHAPVIGITCVTGGVICRPPEAMPAAVGTPPA
jgi:hypothetical protein